MATRKGSGDWVMSGKRRSLGRALVWLFFLGFTGCLLYWMFMGFGRSIRTSGPYHYNSVPFRTIGMYVLHRHSFSTRTWIINIWGNIGVFTPYGFVLPYLFPWARRFVAFLLLFGCSLIILEVLQMLLRVGSLDVDDVILNALGASLSFAVFAGLQRWLKARKSAAWYKI
ncbi:VanZ family protein [Paenibacillus alba]|uniref:VanZ family protein n=1 Tax=Paenibacillus alba TaxID=1197127 RepID=A0ABU6G4P0_9BACL|nr:VanZ family protein [Paenibacillus alba]MEC0229145.1 VanZ family protein [Paenibacillus alba]